MSYTVVTRIPIVEASVLEGAIKDLCNVHAAAGYTLSAVQVVGDSLLLIFQRPVVPVNPA